MEGLGFSIGFWTGAASAYVSIYIAFKLIKNEPKRRVKKEPKTVEFDAVIPETIKKPKVYTTGGKHVPKVRDDSEAYKVEAKKAEEKELVYGG